MMFPKERQGIMETPLLTIPEVAEYLRVSKETVYELVNSAGFPAAKIRGQWRIPSGELEKWVLRKAGISE
jgi:excisionase family DNA binding protein